MIKIIAHYLLFLSLLFSFPACTTKTIVNSDNDDRIPYQLNAYNYSDNHYFLDTAYKSNFLDFMADGQLDNTENFNRQVLNNNFEIWVQTSNTTADRKYASILIDLPPLTSGGQYNDSFYVPKQIQGKRCFGLFRKLSPSEYYINYQAGFIGFKTNINENEFAGVSFSQYGTGYTFGTNSVNFSRDTLVLKMVKAGNIAPQIDTLAWAMKMKNVYRIPLFPIREEGFEFQVNYLDPADPRPSSSLPNGRNLLEVVRLDKYIGHGPIFGQDNYFDFIPGRTIVQESGDIVFPILQPFSDEVYSATGDTSLMYKSVYTKLKSEASIAPNNSMYIIKGRLKNYY